MNKFKKLDGSNFVIEDLAKYIKDYCLRFPNEYLSIFIGCDSLPGAFNNAKYGIVICMYRQGKGAHVIGTKEQKRFGFSLFRRKTKEENAPLVRQRLWHEVELIINLAKYLRDNGVYDIQNVIGVDIHLDLNKNKEHLSNMIYDEAVGYVRGMGFNCELKPNAFAASFAADMLVRNKM